MSYPFWFRIYLSIRSSEHTREVKLLWSCFVLLAMSCLSSSHSFFVLFGFSLSHYLGLLLSYHFLSHSQSFSFLISSSCCSELSSLLLSLRFYVSLSFYFSQMFSVSGSFSLSLCNLIIDLSNHLLLLSLSSLNVHLLFNFILGCLCFFLRCKEV